MFWVGIGAFSNSQDYLNKLNSKIAEQFINDMAIQNYDLSKVATKKYLYLKVGYSFLCWCDNRSIKLVF